MMKSLLFDSNFNKFSELVVLTENFANDSNLFKPEFQIIRERLIFDRIVCERFASIFAYNPYAIISVENDSLTRDSIVTFQQRQDKELNFEHKQILENPYRQRHTSQLTNHLNPKKAIQAKD